MLACLEACHCSGRSQPPLASTPLPCQPARHAALRSRLQHTREPLSAASARSSQSWQQERRGAPCRCRAGGAEASQAAAFAVQQFVRSGSTVGLAGASLALHALEELSRGVRSRELDAVGVVTESKVLAVEAAVQGLPVRKLEDVDKVDLTLCEADEVEGATGALAFLAGGRAVRGQGPPGGRGAAGELDLPRLRALLAKSQRVVLLVSGPDKVVRRLGSALPVAIEAEGWEAPGEAVDDLFLGDGEVWRRSALEVEVSPRGGDSPYTSPEGHHVLDAYFERGLALDGEEAPYGDIAKTLEGIEGVVAHGLFPDVATSAVVATLEGPKLVEQGEQVLGRELVQQSP